MRKITFGLLMLVLVFGLVGCAKPPEQAIAAAKQAVADATTAGAEQYAPESLNAAKDLVTKLDAAVETQNQKFALFRSYKEAEDLANQAKAAGEKATADAKAGKEKAKQEAEQMINTAKTALTEAKDMLAKAPKGKGTAQDLKAMEQDLAAVDGKLAEAEKNLTEEKYLEAKASADAAQKSIDTVKGQVQAAIDAKAAAKAGKK